MIETDHLSLPMSSSLTFQSHRFQPYTAGPAFALAEREEDLEGEVAFSLPSSGDDDAAMEQDIGDLVALLLAAQTLKVFFFSFL